MFIVIRTINRKTHTAHLAGEDATGIRSNHIGDVICVLPDDHKFSGNERTQFAIIKVNVPPPFDEEKIIEQLLESTDELLGWTEPAPLYDEFGDELLDENGEVVMSEQVELRRPVRPRKIKFSRSEFNANFNASDQAKMDRAYDRNDHVAQDDIPEYNWGQFKKLWKDKENGDAVIEVK